MTNPYPPKQPVTLTPPSKPLSPLSKPGTHQIEIGYPWGPFPKIPPIKPGRYGRYEVVEIPKKRTPAYFLPIETMGISFEVKEMRKGLLRKEPIFTFDHANTQPLMPHIAIAKGIVAVDSCDPTTLVYLYNVLRKAEVTRVYLLADIESCYLETAILRTARWPGIEKLSVHDKSMYYCIDDWFRIDHVFIAKSDGVHPRWDDFGPKTLTMYKQELLFGAWLMQADKFENYNSENLSEFWDRFWQSLGLVTPFAKDKKAISWSLAAYAFHMASAYRKDNKHTAAGEFQKIGLKFVGAYQ